MSLGVRWEIEGGDWPTLAGQRAAARRVLVRLLDGEEPALEHDAQGRPCLSRRPDVGISISHCRRAVAVAVCERGRVGIDVECRRRVNPALVERVCTPAEREAVRTTDDPAMAFLQLWTRKEAVLKCLGTGIRGFGSMVAALGTEGIAVSDLPCDLPDVVAALATASE